MPKTTHLPARLKRSESFLGIHFDFHAGDDCTEVGRGVTARRVERVIDLVRPDYIQCDCKGHRGLSSYPTKVGYAAPGVVRDPLRIWRAVTARRGVALYMHYSGVWDAEAVRRHPSWARVDEKGKRDKRLASVFGPYADKLLIPQLRELSDAYGVDGVWVDGECWATAHDYCERAVEAFRRKTGRRRVPRKPTDPDFFAFSELCRQAFRDYLRHYVTALHRHNPHFQIASNWAYTSFMPGPVDVDVDYLSGDYSMQDSVNTARLEARCIRPQGLPWDLMAWSFCRRWAEKCNCTKSVPQLQQEAAVVLAQGGGFQAYFKQNRDGSIEEWPMTVMAEVAKFCRARQRFCHRAAPVPQVGLIYSAAAFYRKNERLFSAWEGLLGPLSGVLRMLLDSQYSVEVLCEHHLAGRMGEYPLLVMPEWDYLAPRFRGELLAYVRGGGSLLVVGPAAAGLFRKELHVRFAGKAEEKTQWLAHGGRLCGLQTVSRPVRLERGAAPVGRLYPRNDPKGAFQPAASVARCGRGRIAATYVNLGERYVRAAASDAREFLADLAGRLFPEPTVEVHGSHHVDVSLNRIDGELAVNLVNTAGPHADENVYVFDEVPPVGPLEITVRRARKPRSVTLQPGGRRLRSRYSHGAVRFTLNRLAIHSVILIR